MTLEKNHLRLVKKSSLQGRVVLRWDFSCFNETVQSSVGKPRYDLTLLLMFSLLGHAYVSNPWKSNLVRSQRSVCPPQTSANRGTDSRFNLEASFESLISKSSRSSLTLIKSALTNWVHAKHELKFFVQYLYDRGSYTFQATQAKSEESEMNIYTTLRVISELRSSLELLAKVQSTYFKPEKSKSIGKQHLPTGSCQDTFKIASWFLTKYFYV